MRLECKGCLSGCQWYLTGGVTRERVDGLVPIENAPRVAPINSVEYSVLKAQTVQPPPNRAGDVLIGTFQQSPPPAIHSRGWSRVAPVQHAILVLREELGG